MIAGGDGRSLTYRNIEKLNINLQTGVGDGLLIYQNGSRYSGGGGKDAFYAGWSKATAGIVWVNDPAKTQTVNGVTVSGLERLLLTTGPGNDTVDNSAVTATDDYLVSGAGDDTVRTGKGDDTVEAGAGNDYINTGSGNDTVYAGDGDDQIQLNEGIADGGAGNDRLAADFSSNGGPSYYFNPSSGSSTYLYVYSSFEAIKTALAGAWASVMIAGGDGRSLTYRNIEKLNINLQTGVGDGLLIYQHGGLYNGGGGTDTFYADWSKTTAAIVWVNAPTQTQTVNGVTVSGLERLLLTTGSGNDILDNSALTATDDYLVSGAGDDTVRTGKGDDTVNAGDGNDTLDGGLGTDILVGGIGNDSYIVASDGDIVTELVDEGIDTVQSSVSHILSANVENLILTGVTGLKGTGNSLANTIMGNAANNLLNGGLGADTLKGGAGNDTYVVDAVGDKLSEMANEGTDTVQSQISWTLGAQLENLTLTGTAAVNGTGNGLANTITGNSANNLLSGGLEADVLNGGAGTDTLVGGTGNDTFVFSSTIGLGGDKVLDFLSGIDKLQLWDGTNGLKIGNGDHFIDNAQLINNHGGFSNLAELVVFTSDIIGTFTTAKAATNIGSATSAFAVGNVRLFVLDNSVDSTLCLFKSAGTDGLVSSNELILIGTLQGAAHTALTDYAFA